jgi:transposase
LPKISALWLVGISPELNGVVGPCARWHALGGEAAARLAADLGLATSADTVLRELRRSDVARRKRAPRVVGIDDWAITRGHRYGTIVVDLERREPIEVFTGRDSASVAA